MSTSTDYSGRKVDLSIFPDNTVPNVPVEASFSMGSRAVAGPLAIAQSFSLALLTPLGHYASDPNYGSTLLSDLTEKKVEYPSDVLHAFALATIGVLSYFDANLPDAPADEKIATVVLDSYNVQGTEIDLSIALTTQAGSTVTFLLPVQWSL